MADAWPAVSDALDVAAAPGYAMHGLAFHGGDLYVSLNAPPAGARLARMSAYPATWCANGTSIVVGAAAQFEHRSLTPGTRYYYRLCAVDKAGNVSTGAAATAVAR